MFTEDVTVDIVLSCHGGLVVTEYRILEVELHT